MIFELVLDIAFIYFYICNKLDIYGNMYLLIGGGNKMNINDIELKRKDGTIVNAKFSFLSNEDLDRIMDLQSKIYNGLEDKQLYSPSSKEEFKEFILGKGKILGCITEDNKLIAMAVYAKMEYDEHNYGYDIELEGKDLLKVGQIESTIVDKEFRGNKLQRKMCEKLEEVAIENNTPILSATASPYNEYSVNTFLNLGYKIMKDKIKYGGLRRYVLIKEL